MKNIKTELKLTITLFSLNKILLEKIIHLLNNLTGNRNSYLWVKAKNTTQTRYKQSKERFSQVEFCYKTFVRVSTSNLKFFRKILKTLRETTQVKFKLKICGR